MIDATAAFERLLADVYASGIESMYGLPTMHFDRTLLWYAEDVPSHEDLRGSFPVWLWPTVMEHGFEADLRHNSEMLGGCGVLALAPWYTCRLDSQNPSRRVNRHVEPSKNERWEPYAIDACCTSLIAGILSEDTSIRILAVMTSTFDGSLESYQALAVPDELRCFDTNARNALAWLHDSNKSGVVLLTTQATVVYVEHQKGFSPHRHPETRETLHSSRLGLVELIAGDPLKQRARRSSQVHGKD